jgi:hypothetical protein
VRADPSFADLQPRKAFPPRLAGHRADYAGKTVV